MKNLFYFLLLIAYSCKSQDCPIKHTDLSDRKYEEYCNKLKEARNKKDYFWEGTALCNLKQPSKEVYKLLNKSIKQHDSLCYQIHDYQHLHKIGAITVSIIKIDTLMWKKLCKECEKIMPVENYYEKKNKDEAAYKMKQVLLQGKLDTNLLDKKLITLLSEIIEKDQRIRGNLKGKRSKENDKQQKYLDSLNLIEIDAIFKKEGGFPSVQKVGYEQVMTPWFVLQHQTSHVVRRKYMSLMEDAVQKGYINKNLLDNYRDRTLSYEEDEQRIQQKPAH